jgi:hypothetical protein
MQRNVAYNILRDGDKCLRGRIAELIFEKVRSKLLERLAVGGLYCCGTSRLSSFLHACPAALLSLDIDSLLRDYEARLNTARSLLGLERIKAISLPKEDLKELCLFCLEKGEVKVFIEVDDRSFDFLVCKNCFSKCLERGLLCPEAEEVYIPLGKEEVVIRHACCLTPSTHPPVRYLVNNKKGVFRGLVRDLLKTLSLLEYLDVIEVLSKLDAQTRDFLYELYGKGTLPVSFDYICADGQGNKYLVDVTSLRGLKGSPAPLSEKERQVAVVAKKKGFKVLVPVVRFLQDWWVLIELTEV